MVRFSKQASKQKANTQQQSNSNQKEAGATVAAGVSSSSSSSNKLARRTFVLYCRCLGALRSVVDKYNRCCKKRENQQMSQITNPPSP
jgi:hypothetical protein